MPKQKKPIKFMGVEMVEQNRTAFSEVAYDAHTPYGRAHILRIQDPRPGFRREVAFDFTLAGAIIGRALRPGEAAKRGEKWLTKMLATHLKHQRELLESRATREND